MDNIRGAQSSKYTIPAGGSIDIGATGEFVRCLEASAQFKLSVNAASAFYFDRGLQYTTRSPDTFDQLTLINETAADITVVMVWGFGEVHDSRLSIVGGNLSVQNVAGQKLNVTDTDTQAALAAVKVAADQIKAALQGDKTLRQGLTDTRTATRGQVLNSGGNVTFVSAAANVNG
ncbi:MAG: hypothetical protein DI626_06250, partial [Micavibrio aeruginosavorus]